MTEQMMIDLMLANQKEIYEKDLAQTHSILAKLFQATVSVLGDDEHRGHTTEETLELCRNAVYAYLHLKDGEK